jgi:hemerythrin
MAHPMQNPPGMGDVRERLQADHQELAGLFQRLKDAVEGADGPTIQQVWSEFEGRLLAHLKAEETYLLPSLEGAHLREVARALAEHGRIRRLLADLGIRTDLHTLRKEAADDLVRQLEAHAAWEDGSIYKWAEAELSPRDHSSLLEAIASFAKHARSALPHGPS